VRVRRVLGTVAAAALACGGTLAVGSPAGAATFTPASTTDSATAGSNSLRDIIQNQATNAGGDEVDLAPGATYVLNVCTPGQLVHGATPLIISTPSGSPATIQQTCTGQRVLAQNGPPTTLTLNNVIISGGNLTGNNGINGGAIATTGAVTVTNSTLTNNTTTASNENAAGGAISAGGAVTVTNSTLTNNTATGGPNGLGAGGAISAGGAVTVTNSTLTKNTATTTNTTTATTRGGGVDALNVTLVYATVVQNTAPTGANLDPTATAPAPSTLTSFGSVVAQPSGGANCAGFNSTTSNGFNFSDDTSCAFNKSTDHQGAGNNPQLGGLAANGGPTNTMVPDPGSPLIDAIPDPGGGCPAAPTITTDQRGLPRPSGPGCDIGAVEVQVAAQASPVAPAAVTVTPKFTG
jgi:hypothetical protein